MAKLSSHGTEIGRIVYTTKIDAYFEDGKVLRNAGFGWKLRAKVKDGHSIYNAYTTAIEKQKAFLASHPFLAAYRKKLHNLAGIGKAWKLHTAVSMMPQDPDGVWSETCDGYGDNVSADIDDVSKLCTLYELAVKESAELRASKTTAEA